MKRTILMALVLALVGCATAPAAIVTTTYEFIPDQSTVVVYGGWGGGPSTFYVEGQFQLTVDYDAGSASFDQVNTNDIWGDSVADIFYMTELDGTVVSDSRIDFLSESADPSWPYANILLELTFRDDSVHLTSITYYPRYAPDAPAYVLDATAVPEPMTILLFGLGGLVLRKHVF